MAGSDSSSRTTPAKGERSWCSSDSSIRRCRFSSLKKSSTVSKVCSLSLTTSANVLPSGFPKNSSRVTFTFAMSHFLRLANVFFAFVFFAFVFGAYNIRTCNNCIDIFGMCDGNTTTKQKKGYFSILILSRPIRLFARPRKLPSRSVSKTGSPIPVPNVGHFADFTKQTTPGASCVIMPHCIRREIPRELS